MRRNVVEFGYGSLIFDTCLHTAVHVVHIEVQARVVKVYWYFCIYTMCVSVRLRWNERLKFLVPIFR